MADLITNTAPDDDLLTAFLDGELATEDRRAIEARLATEPALKARFDALAGSARPFVQAFAMVLDAAPAERLRSTLAEVAPHAGPVAPRRVWTAAAAVLLFAVGIAVGVGTDNGPSQFAPRAVQSFSAPDTGQSEANQVIADQSVPGAPVRTPGVPAGQGDGADAARSRAVLPPPAPSLALAPASSPEPLPRQAESQQFVAAPKAVGEASTSAAPVPAPAMPSATANSAASGLAAIAAAADALGTLQPPPSWRQVVVEYLVLTTPETLALIPDNPRLSDAVAAYAGKLQLDISADKLMLPAAALKDVRLFDYRGRPLVEAAFLSDDAVAVAFCIIFNGQTDAAMAFEEREGQNIVFWTRSGHGYMVAGKVPRERLEEIARDFAGRFS